MATPDAPPDGAASSRLAKIFRERASFELGEDDVEALSRELASATRLSGNVPLTAEDAARREAEAAALTEWTVRAEREERCEARIVGWARVCRLWAWSGASDPGWGGWRGERNRGRAWGPAHTPRSRTSGQGRNTTTEPQT